MKTAYQWEAKSQWRGKPFTGDIAVSVEFVFATKRKRDPRQNKRARSAVRIVYEDVAQVAELRLMRRYDAQRPRIEISVTSSTETKL